MVIWLPNGQRAQAVTPGRCSRRVRGRTSYAWEDAPLTLGGETRGWLEGVESGDVGDPEAPLAFLAVPHVALDQTDLRAARRRALLLLAAGGDPRRELDVDGRAVRSLA